VITGGLAVIPPAKKILDGISKIYGIPFFIPDKAEYATAVGAALSHFHL
jgi:type II pantothenate kinase